MPVALRQWRLVYTLAAVAVTLVVLILIAPLVRPVGNLPSQKAKPPSVALERSARERDADAQFDYKDPKLKLDTSPIEILLWNGGSWASWGTKTQIDVPNYFTNSKPIPKPECPIECIFTQDHSRAGMVDAIMLEPTVPFGIDAWKEDPPALPEKLPHQTLLLYHYESSEYFPLLAQRPLLAVVDGQVSYRQNAWLQATFFCPFASKTLEDLLLPPPPKKDPNKLVVFITSNCGSGGAARRLAYVQELMKYIPVDSYGACLHNKDPPTPHHMRQQEGMPHGDVMLRRIEIVSEYKFAISFENTDQEVDYVTEKVWMTWASGTVPIYWGTPNIDEWLPGDDSIINAGKFTPKELATHLHALARDERAYQHYFEWKKRPLSAGFRQLVDNCVIYADCRICKKLARLRGRPSWPGLPSEAPLYRAVKLADEDDSVEVPPAPPLDLTEEYTLSAWVFLEAFGAGARIVDKAIEGTIGAYSWDVLENWGRSYVRLCAADDCFQSRYGLLHRFRWTHVAVTFSLSAKKIRFYINGEQAGQAAMQRATRTTPLPLRIGGPSGRRSERGSGAGVNLLGLIDSVSVWSRALTMHEVQRLMFRRPRGNESALVAFWGFDEREGAEVRDASLNKLHGVLKGGAHRVAVPRRPIPNMDGVATLPPTEKDFLYYGAAMGVIGCLMVVLLVILTVLVRLNYLRRAQLRQHPV